VRNIKARGSSYQRGEKSQITRAKRKEERGMNIRTEKKKKREGGEKEGESGI